MACVSNFLANFAWVPVGTVSLLLSKEKWCSGLSGLPHTHTKPASNRIRLFEIPQTLKPWLSLLGTSSNKAVGRNWCFSVWGRCKGSNYSGRSVSGSTRGSSSDLRLGSVPCCQTKARSCLVSPLAATLPGHSAARCVATQSTRHGSYFCTFKPKFNKCCRLHLVDERPQLSKERITSLNAMVFISSVSCRAV